MRQSKIKESVSEDMVQYLDTLDKIAENDCEEMDGRVETIGSENVTTLSY